MLFKKYLEAVLKANTKILIYHFSASSASQCHHSYTSTKTAHALHNAKPRCSQWLTIFEGMVVVLTGLCDTTESGGWTLQMTNQCSSKLALIEHAVIVVSQTHFKHMYRHMVGVGVLCK